MVTPAAKRILFLSRDHGSVQATVPVMLALSRDPRYALSVVSMAVSRSVLESHDIRHEPLNEAAYSQDPSACLDALLSRLQPDLVVSGSSPAKGDPPETVEQFLIRAARRRGVPSLGILDFWGLYRERFDCDPEGRAAPALLPDHLCVLDTSCRDDLLALGVPADRLHVTHNPWVDAIVGRADAVRTERPAALQGADRTILFVSQPLAENAAVRKWGYTQDSLFQHLLDGLAATSRNQTTRVLVWPHPTEQGERWHPTNLPTRPNVEVRVTDEREFEVLATADLLVTSHSTLAYEALYYGTPCMSLRIGGPGPQGHVTDRLGLSVRITSAEALREFLAQADLRQMRAELIEKRRALARESTFFSDGQATQRVLHVIADAIR
jgi:hypothetical protein